MELQKISLMDAYMLETLRRKGITNQQLLTEKDFKVWNYLHESFDFSHLQSLREKDPTAFQTVVEEVYQVKFVTFKGLINLLKLKFQKVEEQDYQTTERGIRGLYLNDEERHQLTNLLSKNWTIQEEEVGKKTLLQIELV
ncbi:hypothetical protein P5F77_13865 [Caldifermentibacillus hisashii]|uniref:hypothetical protein n=1 Tax=Caldifermentibacillus hisashii TaxID=996558 RepID=UPI0030D63239